jgi:TonB family protein
MRFVFGVVLFIAPALGCLGQTAGGDAPGLPKDAKELFAAAAPFYDFSDPALKPWHLKASYQLYDEEGKPGEQGTFEYWWASPKVYRSSWTRAGAAHTDWHTAEGKHATLATGERLKYFEYKIQGALLSPLPEARDLNPEKSRLDRETVSLGSIKLPCVMVIPLMASYGHVETVPLGLFPTYCFDQKLPVLRIRYSLGSLTEEFNRIAKLQRRYLPREITLLDGKRKILSATVDSADGIAATDQALTPAPEATVAKLERVQISSGVSQGLLLKKLIPIYPQDAQQARMDGRVVLQATIGADGGIHDLKVVSTPWPSLAASALWAVSHWEYRPYILNGEPVEVETTINVIFTLGG